MIKFSIIVPVYNVEKYLTECIESILNQSFDNYEIILVNDGSTDNSGELCENYKLSHSIIKTIHKENGGLSDARNRGLREAKGEYIVFVDSDDYIESGTLDAFNSTLKEFNQPDVMISLVREIYTDSEPRYMDKAMPVNFLKDAGKKKIINWMFNHSNNLWPAQRYIVSRKFIEKNGMNFARGRLHEDIDWTSRLFLYAKTFTISDFYWYNHRIGRLGAITSVLSPKRTLDIIDLVSMNMDNPDYNRLERNLKTTMFKRMLKSVFVSLSNYELFDSQGQREVIEALENNKDIFRYTVRFKHRSFILVSKLLGFKVALSISGLVHKV